MTTDATSYSDKPRTGRVGRFKVSTGLLRDALSKDRFDEGECAYEGMIVTRAENMFCSDMIELMAFHREFDLINLNEEVPLYDVLITLNIDDKGVRTYSREIKRQGE